MPLFTLKSYHYTACTVGSGMKREEESGRQREGEGDVESHRHTFSSASSSQSVKEHLNTHSKSYLAPAVLLNSSFSRHSRKQGEREPRNNQPCLSFCSTEGSYNETHSSIVESLIIHCGNFAGGPYHITI